LEFIATYFCRYDKPHLESQLHSNIKKEVFSRNVRPEDNSFQSCFDQLSGHRAALLSLLHLVNAIVDHSTLSACKESHFKSAKKHSSANPDFKH